MEHETTKRLKTESPPSPSYSPTRDTQSKYEVVSPTAVARGAYGAVFSALDKRNPKRRVAIKQIAPMSQDEVGLASTSLREISILKEAGAHANIVKLLDVETSTVDGVISLVFEWMDCDLQTLLDLGEIKLNSAKRRFLFRQLATGVAFMHSRSIFHRDLKPANILIDKRSLALKIADFGLGRRYVAQRTYTRDVVSQFYRAPEILLGLREYTLAIDIWSLGCVFAELGLKRALFGGGVSEFDQLLKIFSVLGTPKKMPAGCVFFAREHFPCWPKPVSEAHGLPMRRGSVELDLLERLLEMDHTKRITADQVLEHKYFDH